MPTSLLRVKTAVPAAIAACATPFVLANPRFSSGYGLSQPA